MKTMKKIVAILAVALMLCSILPLSVFAADTEIVFNLGANGSASHADGTSKTTYSETVSGYTLSITNGTQFYTGARDAKGNSCLKLGSSKNVGSFKFTVPDDVTSVIIEVAKYKSNATKMNINGTAYTLTKNSNDGAYDLITVDTTSTKTVSVAVSSGPRAMINTITFVIAAAAGDCEHDWVTEQTKAPDCTNAGENTLTCSKCGESKTEAIDALGHSYGEAVETVAPDCITEGEQESTCSVCGDVKTETVKALGHTWVDGFCDVCGDEKPLETTIDFSTKDQRTEYSTSKQVWENDGLTLVNDKASSTSNVGDYANPARFYKSSTITITYAGMTSLVIDANGISSNGDWKATLSAYTYTVDSNVYTITFADPTDSITLTCAAQVRANSITAYGSAPSDCEHDYVGVETQAPTCSVEGVMTYTCSKCQESYTEAIATIPHSYVEDIIDSTCTATGTATYECSVCGHSYDEEIAKKPHNYVDDVCADCGHVKAYKGTIDFSNAEQRTELTTQIQIWANEGLTFTNNKLTGNNIADYTNPIRIYKNSGIVIEFPEMSKLIIDANGIGNDYLWDATLEAAGLSFTVANGIYTITFAEAKNSIELTCANQVRANSITAIVAHECVYDHACDADCNKCGETREVADHEYTDAFDTTCNNCGAVRSVVAPSTACGFSRSEDVRGLAVRFEIPVTGMGIDVTTAIYDNATVNGYKLISMGAIASNGVSQKDIPAVYLCNDDVSTSAKFAIRIINIPEGKEDVQVTFTPYVIVEIDGEQTTIYGEAVSSSFNG